MLLLKFAHLNFNQERQVNELKMRSLLLTADDG